MEATPNRTEKKQRGTFRLSEEGLAYVQKEMKRYETKQSAIIPSLYRVQAENKGWVSPEAMAHLSEVMGIPVAQIEEVARFYTMFNKQPVGKHHIQVCCNISCCMADARELTDHIEHKLGVRDDEMTSDGLFTVSRVECLGSCGTAPVVQVNETYYESQTKESVDKLIDELRRKG